MCLVVVGTTPRLQRAIRLLSLNWPALLSEIRREVRSNPALELIAPSPAESLDTASVADAELRRDRCGYVATPGDATMPRLDVLLPERLLGRASIFDESERKRVEDLRRDASFFLRSLEKREELVVVVAQLIADHAGGWLDGEPLEPPGLSLAAVAEQLDIHESTVSRVLTGKHVRTPRGLVPFRRFFVSRDGHRADEATRAQAAAWIRALVSEESPDRPLSDRALVHALSAQGIRIARRTVAKLREQQGIPSSSKRRRRAP